MKKRVFSYIILMLSVWAMSAMDPTSPRSAHPERAQRVEGRRDSNHAIAPEEQRRMDQIPLDQAEFQKELKLDDILTDEVVTEATKSSVNLTRVKPKVIILYNNKPTDDEECSNAAQTLIEALSISSGYENPQDLEVSVNWQQLQSLFPAPREPVIQRVAITDATPKTVTLSNVNELQTPQLNEAQTILQKALTINSHIDNATNINVTVDWQQIKQLTPQIKHLTQQRTLIERITDPVTLTTAAVVGLICWKLSASASE